MTNSVTYKKRYRKCALTTRTCTQAESERIVNQTNELKYVNLNNILITREHATQLPHLSGGTLLEQSVKYGYVTNLAA